MSYVDLNPIREGMAKTPESSDHTSIKLRAKCFAEDSERQPEHLMPLIGQNLLSDNNGIAFKTKDYLELVDWTGRQIRDNPIGSIDEEAPPILQRLSISPKHWIYLCTQFESRFKGIAGTAESLKQNLNLFKLVRRPNIKNSVLLFS